MRKYNLAYRYREFAEMAVPLPWQKPLSIGITYFWAEDNFSQSQLGMH